MLPPSARRWPRGSCGDEELHGSHGSTTTGVMAAAYGERSEEETRWMFVEWMAEYGKTYNAISEEERRYAVFKDELRDIDQHNAATDAGVYPYTVGLNQFSDLTFEEWRARYCGGLLMDSHPVAWKKKGAKVAEI